MRDTRADERRRKNTTAVFNNEREISGDGFKSRKEVRRFVRENSGGFLQNIIPKMQNDPELLRGHSNIF